MGVFEKVMERFWEGYDKKAPVMAFYSENLTERDQVKKHQRLFYVEPSTSAEFGSLDTQKQAKEAIRAKKDAFKVSLQDRSSSDLQPRYTEAPKAATSAVKKS